MNLDETTPIDGDGITTGVKISELAGHIRQLKTDLNQVDLDEILDGTTYKRPLGVVTDADTSWHEIGADGEPAFQNSWVNFGGDWSPAEFRKDALGFVEVRGMIKDGVITGVVLTLPSGYRPGGDLYFSTVSNLAFGGIIVKADGDVVAQVGNNAWFSICCRFYAG